jgi:hypothetical protein
MFSRRGLLVAFAAGTAAIGLTGLSEDAANAAKTYTVCKTSAVPVKAVAPTPLGKVSVSVSGGSVKVKF